MSGIFRKEAAEAQRRKWLGEVSIVQPIRLWQLAAISLVGAFSVICFIYFGEYSRRSRVVGELVPDLGLSTVIAPFSGVVSRIDVDEGEDVSLHRRLLTVNVPRITATGQDVAVSWLEEQRNRIRQVNAIGASQDRQLLVQQRGATAQKAAMVKELSQIESEIETRVEQVRIARLTLERYKSVQDERYVSLVQINQQEQSVLEIVNAKQLLERQATAIRRELSALDQRLAEIAPQRLSIKAASERDLATLSQEALRMETDGELMLRAPVAGLVANRFVEAGQVVRQGDPLMTLLPQGSELHAQLLVPSSAIGFVKSGDQVTLRYHAYPYQKFGTHQGTVVRISRSALSGTSNTEPGSQPVYRILVSLKTQDVIAYGQAEPLRPGMQLEADIVGERRRIYEWLLEPLYSVTGKI